MFRTVAQQQLGQQIKNHTGHTIIRPLSSVPAERNADFAPRIITNESFPDINVKKLARGTGFRSSFNGLIVTVFGSSGFLAASLVNQLGKIGSQVICPYRGDPYFIRERRLAGDLGQILFVPFSLRDTDTVYRAVKHSNVVINLIGKDNETKNFDFESIHVEGPRTIARIAREAGIKRLIHVSALNSSPDPPAHYIKGGSKFLRTKYYGEQAVREEFPDATIFRPADMYGLGDNYLNYLCRYWRRQRLRLPLPNGGYGITKTPVKVSDVACGIVNAITDEDSLGKTYDCVGPRRYELRTLMRYLQEVIEKPEVDGFKITNLNVAPLMRARITLLTQLANFGVIRMPKVCWEKVEREAISDEKPQNPTLSDLGVRLSYIEEHWPFILEKHRFIQGYDGDLGEQRLFSNPKYLLDS